MVPVQVVPAGTLNAIGWKSVSFRVELIRRHAVVTYKVLIDVGSTLHDVVHGTSPQTSLVGWLDIAIVAWDLSGGLEHDTVTKGTSTGGVQDGLDRTSTISGDDVVGSRNAATG